MSTDAEVMIAQNTTGSYFIRVELESGVIEVQLTPEEFAKAVTGKMAKGTKVINSITGGGGCRC